MSIARAYADRDTTIWEKSITANTGLSPILQVHTVFNSVQARKEHARILLRLSLSSLTGSIIAGDYPDPRTDSTVTAYLYVQNAPHGDEQAKSFNLNVHAISTNWDEGTGLDNDGLTETGYANAVSAQTSVAWTTSGGDYYLNSTSSTQAFDDGEERLKVNVTELLKNWMNGVTSNFGVLIKLTDAEEAKTGSLSATSYNYKKFYGRTTNTRKRPYLQIEWDGAIQDDRSAIAFNSTGNLFFYNIVNGQLQDLDSSNAFPGNITISGTMSDASVTAIHTGLTAARHSKGIYKCGIGTLPLTANQYATYTDDWFLSASPTANYTFNFFTVNPASGFDEFKTAQYNVSMENLRKSYEYKSKARIRMHIKDGAYLYTPLTAATTAISNFIVTNGTVEIREAATDEVEVTEYSLSYDKNGNFFEMDTQWLYPGIAYKPVVKLNVRGETYYYEDPKWTFEVQ